MENIKAQSITAPTLQSVDTSVTISFSRKQVNNGRRSYGPSGPEQDGWTDLGLFYRLESRWRLDKSETLVGGTQAAQTLKVMENLYKETFAKIDGSKSTIPIKIGLRQGAVDSCSLFNYWLDTCRASS